MITKEKKASSKDKVNNFQILKDILTPSESSDLLMSLLDTQINFYKLKFMSKWERNHLDTEMNGDDTIKELEKQKNQLKQLIMQARFEGCNLKINSSLEITCDK